MHKLRKLSDQPEVDVSQSYRKVQHSDSVKHLNQLKRSLLMSQEKNRPTRATIEPADNQMVQARHPNEPLFDVKDPHFSKNAGYVQKKQQRGESQINTKGASLSPNAKHQLKKLKQAKAAKLQFASLSQMDSQKPNEKRIHLSMQRNIEQMQKRTMAEQNAAKSAITDRLEQHHQEQTQQLVNKKIMASRKNVQHLVQKLIVDPADNKVRNGKEVFLGSYSKRPQPRNASSSIKINPSNKSLGKLLQLQPNISNEINKSPSHNDLPGLKLKGEGASPQPSSALSNLKLIEHQFQGQSLQSPHTHISDEDDYAPQVSKNQLKNEKLMRRLDLSPLQPKQLTTFKSLRSVVNNSSMQPGALDLFAKQVDYGQDRNIIKNKIPNVIRQNQEYGAILSQRNDSLVKLVGISEHLLYSARQSPDRDGSTASLPTGQSLLSLESVSRDWRVVKGARSSDSSQNNDIKAVIKQQQQLTVESIRLPIASSIKSRYRFNKADKNSLMNSLRSSTRLVPESEDEEDNQVRLEPIFPKIKVSSHRKSSETGNHYQKKTSLGTLSRKYEVPQLHQIRQQSISTMHLKRNLQPETSKKLLEMSRYSINDGQFLSNYDTSQNRSLPMQQKPAPRYSMPISIPLKQQLHNLSPRFEREERVPSSHKSKQSKVAVSVCDSSNSERSQSAETERIGSGEATPMFRLQQEENGARTDMNVKIETTQKNRASDQSLMTSKKDQRDFRAPFIEQRDLTTIELPKKSSPRIFDSQVIPFQSKKLPPQDGTKFPISSVTFRSSRQEQAIDQHSFGQKLLSPKGQLIPNLAPTATAEQEEGFNPDLQVFGVQDKLTMNRWTMPKQSLMIEEQYEPVLIKSRREQSMKEQQSDNEIVGDLLIKIGGGGTGSDGEQKGLVVRSSKMQEGKNQILLEGDFEELLHQLQSLAAGPNAKLNQKKRKAPRRHSISFRTNGIEKKKKKDKDKVDPLTTGHAAQGSDHVNSVVKHTCETFNVDVEPRIEEETMNGSLPQNYDQTQPLTPKLNIQVDDTEAWKSPDCSLDALQMQNLKGIDSSKFYAIRRDTQFEQLVVKKTKIDALMNNELIESFLPAEIKTLCTNAFKNYKNLPSAVAKNGTETFRHAFNRRDTVERTNLVIIRASELLLSVETSFSVESGERKQKVKISPRMLQMIAQIVQTKQVAILLDFPDQKLTSWLSSLLQDKLNLQVDAIYSYKGQMNPSTLLLDISHIINDFRLLSNFQLNYKRSLRNQSLFTFVEAMQENKAPRSQIFFNSNIGHDYSHVVVKSIGGYDQTEALQDFLVTQVIFPDIPVKITEKTVTINAGEQAMIDRKEEAHKEYVEAKEAMYQQDKLGYLKHMSTAEQKVVRASNLELSKEIEWLKLKNVNTAKSRAAYGNRRNAVAKERIEFLLESQRPDVWWKDDAKRIQAQLKPPPNVTQVEPEVDDLRIADDDENPTCAEVPPIEGAGTDQQPVEQQEPQAVEEEKKDDDCLLVSTQGMGDVDAPIEEVEPNTQKLLDDVNCRLEESQEKTSGNNRVYQLAIIDAPSEQERRENVFEWLATRTYSYKPQGSNIQDWLCEKQRFDYKMHPSALADYQRSLVGRHDNETKRQALKRILGEVNFTLNYIRHSYNSVSPTAMRQQHPL